MGKVAKKVVKKKGSRPAGGPAAGGAPLRLEVGKTYITRDGRWKAKILAHDGTINWPYIGRWIGEDPTTVLDCATMPSWREDGGIYHPGQERPTDLVREVPRPPRAK